MIANITYPIALLASALWFAAAFRYFSYQQGAAAKVMVPRTARDSPIFPTIGAALRFLGGMNAAFALLSIILLALWASGAPVFTQPVERGILLATLAVAHFSQFIFNVPILKNGGRQGASYWNVLSGPMYFIFVMDAGQAAINAVASVLQFMA